MVPFAIEYKLASLLILGLIIIITIVEAHEVIDKGTKIFCPKHLTEVKKEVEKESFSKRISGSFNSLLLLNKDPENDEIHVNGIK